MCISETLKNYLKDSVSITGNCFYITNLSNILYFTSGNTSENYNLPISKELLKILLSFSNNISSSDIKYVLADTKDLVIPIFEDKLLNINWSSQIIYPIYIDDKLFGSLIMTSYHKSFCNNNLTTIETTEEFVKKFILKYLREAKKGVDDIAE